MAPELPSLLDSFRENPLHFVVPVALAGLGLALGAVGLVVVGKSPKATLVLGVIALVFGTAAVTMGVASAAKLRSAWAGNLAVPGLTERDRANMTAMIDHQAGQVRTVGMLAGALPAILGALGIVLGATRKARPPR